MDVKITDLAALQACSPDQVSLYLRANRWLPELVQGGTVWRFSDENDTEVFIPGSSAMKGYSAFLADALSTISEVEDRSELQIIREIAAASSDVQYVRTKPDGEAGTTSLIRQSEIVIWSSAGEAGSLVEPAGAGLVSSSPDVPAQVVFEAVPVAGE